MFPFRVLNQAAIQENLDMRSCLEIVERAYTLKDEQKATLFPMVFHEFEPGVADMDIKSGHLAGANIFGLKLVSWFGENPAKGLPAIIGTVMVLDSKTGAPIGIMSGEAITLMRTGAAAGVGAKQFARADSKVLLSVGSGHLGPYHILATLMVLENIEKVLVYNPRSVERATAFCTTIREKCLGLLAPYRSDQEFYDEMVRRIHVPFEVVQDIALATAEADVINTATPSKQALIKKEWVKAGTHITCLGADMEGKQELDEHIYANAKVFVDDVTQAVNVGETEIPIKKGTIQKDALIEIGSVIRGRKPSRTSDHDITVFDSTGIALQDLLTAESILKEAEKNGSGVVADI
ncbi:ornithine cyclodeaminase family protein [Shimazuella kribbensis]|uniref:ornithine cyclodeaminase family protein n=1 Tax=Shimazuella kribbensis TaxID=139808 RepID=UPI0003F58756|nr:ornithine cyclodeaminase family protein [Shimazuella kribbensis]